jgi:hypothetical protein
LISLVRLGRHEVGIIRWPEIVENSVREEASFKVICRFRIDAKLPVAFYVDLRGQGSLEFDPLAQTIRE